MKIVATDKMERGLAYGEACFETFRVIDGDIFAWEAHCRRLAVGLSEFAIELSEAQFEYLHAACLEQAEAAGEDVLVRLTVSGGEASWGLAKGSEPPASYIQVIPFSGRRVPVSLQLRNWPFPLKAKRAKFIADYSETLRVLKGSSNLDLLFAQDGLLIAAVAANLLIYREGRWWTPSAGSGVLPGVVRGHLIASGAACEAECPVTWLEDADAVALSNCGQFILPVAEVSKINSFDVGHPAFQELTKVLAGEPGAPKDLM